MSTTAIPTSCSIVSETTGLYWPHRRGRRAGKVRRRIASVLDCGTAPSAMEAGPVEAWPGDLRPVRAAARRVDRVPPLGEEPAELRAARRGRPREERRKRRFELRLGDAPLPVRRLNLLQRGVEHRRTED